MRRDSKCDPRVAERFSSSVEGHERERRPHRAPLREVTNPRFDAHIEKPGDFTHFCYSPLLWEGVFANLHTQLMKWLSHQPSSIDSGFTSPTEGGRPVRKGGCPVRKGTDTAAPALEGGCHIRKGTGTSSPALLAVALGQGVFANLHTQLKKWLEA